MKDYAYQYEILSDTYHKYEDLRGHILYPKDLWNLFFKYKPIMRRYRSQVLSQKAINDEAAITPYDLSLFRKFVYELTKDHEVEGFEFMYNDKHYLITASNEMLTLDVFPVRAIFNFEGNIDTIRIDKCSNYIGNNMIANILDGPAIKSIPKYYNIHSCIVESIEAVQMLIIDTVLGNTDDYRVRY